MFAYQTKGGVRMRYLRRLIWHIASRLFAFLLVLGILSITFYFAMNATNIYIIVKDGMARRAQVIMMDTSLTELDKYFSASWIARDEMIRNAQNNVDPYRDCKITGFDHRISLSTVWCWPWEDTARATMRESIPRIDGKVKSSMRDTVTQLGLTASPPRWQSAEYSVLLSRENGRWIIKNMTVTEVINE